MSGKARRGNGEGSVYQDKNRVWHAKLTVGRYRNGKPRYKEFKGKRKADVIARRDAYQKEYGDLSLESGANIPFADYITRWMIAAINEFERANTLERQREGIAIAKRNGVYKGRKPAQLPPDFDVLYARYQCRELNKTQLAAAVGVSRPTLERLLREYKT